MFIEKELGYKRHWINIDSDIISEQSYLYTKYDIDQETIEYALDKMNEPTWITTVRMGQSPLSIMFWHLKRTRNTISPSR